MADDANSGPLLPAIIQAMVLPLIVNVTIFFLTNALVDDPIVDPNSGDEMPFAAVLISTVFWTLGAVAVYWLVVRRLGRSMRVFQIIAFIALIFSFLPVFLGEGTNATTTVALSLMHLATYAIVLASVSGLTLLLR